MAEEQAGGVAMPVISINKRYLYGLVGRGMDDHRLADYLSKLGFEVEKLDEEEVSVEITANRPDLLDAVGLARTLKNFMHKSKRFHYEMDDGQPALEISVEDSVDEIRPCISALVAFNVRVDENALLNMINFSEKFCDTYGRNRRKIAMGFHDFDAIRGSLVYKSGDDLEFVPLGKQNGMSFSRILESEETGRRYADTVRGPKRCFYPALMDSEGPIAFIPILNSQRTRITTSTRNMFVDITGLSEYAVNRVADLMAASFIDMGAEVRRVRIRHGETQHLTPEMEKRYITIPTKTVEREIGVAVGYNNVISLANKMGYEAGLLGNKIKFRVPEYRLDVIDEQDVLEDMVIGYGYEYINPVPIGYSQPGCLEDRTIFHRRMADLMVGLGFSECTNSYLTNGRNNFEKAGIEDDGTAIMLKNSNTETITMMRTWLIPSLLSDLELSGHERMPQSVFEIDLAFAASNKKPVESYRLAAVSVDPKANFNTAKAMVEGLLRAAGVDYGISELKHGAFIEGRVAGVTIGSRSLGFFGELHPRTLKNFGIEEPGIALELRLDTLHPKS
jgi:phenylalanyl-tRNA synthetase beta chain